MELIPSWLNIDLGLVLVCIWGKDAVEIFDCYALYTHHNHSKFLTGRVVVVTLF